MNTAVASVDMSVVLGEAKTQFGLAKGGIEERAKGAAGSMKGLFGRWDSALPRTTCGCGYAFADSALNRLVSGLLEGCESMLDARGGLCS